MVECTLTREESNEEVVRRATPATAVKRNIPKVADPPVDQPAIHPELTESEEATSYTSANVQTNTPPPVAKVNPINNENEKSTNDEIEESPLTAGSDIVQLQENWSKMINNAPDGLSKTIAAALLRSASPMKIEDDTITVSLKFSYHKEKMDNVENQKTADKIVSGFLGRSCRVRCIYEHENNHLVKAALDMGAQRIDTEEI